MKQPCVIIVLSFCLVFPATAQLSIGASVAPAIPLGDFSQFASFGFGFNLNGRYMAGEKLGFGLGVGWYKFNTRFDDELNYRVTPITASVEYFFSSINEPTPYIGLHIGSYAFNSYVFGYRVSDPYFGMSPALGISYPLSDQLLFDGNVQCSFIFSELGSRVYLPINLGIHYNFGK